MRKKIRNFLRDEEHASAVLTNSALAIMVIGFALALGAIAFLK